MADAVYRPGDIVPKSGVYRIDHHLHRLMHEATLLEGEKFPLCRKCRAGVSYSLVRAVNGSVPPFRPTEILEEYPEASGPSARKSAFS
jgi:hypothetical protein